MPPQRITIVTKQHTYVLGATNVLDMGDPNWSGRWYSLADVMSAYPDGLHPKDAAWMWRRLLFAVGYAHSAGVVHGAIVPEHVIIEPEQHGLALIDWCYSKMTPFGPLTAIVPNRRDLYPADVFDKKPVSEATDIYMATKTMELLLNDQTPSQIRAFIRGCTVARANDAWRLREEFDDLIVRLWGARKFRPFSMPATA
jgi:serine/threonine protein kinase